MEAENPYKSPEASVEAAAQGKLSEVFERYTAWAVFGLGIITFGLYSVYWLVSRTKQMNARSDQVIGNGLIYSMLVFYILSFVSNFVTLADPTIGGILGLSGLPAIVLMYVVVYKLRNRIHTYVGSQPSTHAWAGPILTFFFTVIYLQYKINKIIDNE
ncbi:DUF4234 domain-containing protein [Teredinibacter purpureus]|uniref:DUF4234 domain-containing protein n=1 Tax=Teredinibacter purpureus TaxID=2731756 RepID=UPI000696EE34|nr:DUF4234 domain-containing protein [Teredinibacter purpureus]